MMTDPDGLCGYATAAQCSGGLLYTGSHSFAEGRAIAAVVMFVAAVIARFPATDSVALPRLQANTCGDLLLSVGRYGRGRRDVVAVLD
jgi:hypothetical protein